MNLGKIYDITTQKYVGIICCDPNSGDVAYYTQDNDLTQCLDILLDSRLYFNYNYKVNNGSFHKKMEIRPIDKQYIIAINYNLPFPWRVLGIENATGDINEVVDKYSYMLLNSDGGDN